VLVDDALRGGDALGRVGDVEDADHTGCGDEVEPDGCVAQRGERGHHRRADAACCSGDDDDPCTHVGSPRSALAGVSLAPMVVALATDRSLGHHHQRSAP